MTLHGSGLSDAFVLVLYYLGIINDNEHYDIWANMVVGTSNEPNWTKC